MPVLKQEARADYVPVLKQEARATFVRSCAMPHTKDAFKVTKRGANNSTDWMTSLIDDQDVPQDGLGLFQQDPRFRTLGDVFSA